MLSLYLALREDVEVLILSSLFIPTYIRYFRKYLVSKKEIKSRKCVGRDSQYGSRQGGGAYVYEREDTDIVRFSDYNPNHNSEAFFYGLLLEEVPFRDEAALISDNNSTGSYMDECIIRKVIDTQEDLEELILNYSRTHMFREGEAGATLEHLYSVCPGHDDLGNLVPNQAEAATEHGHGRLDVTGMRLPSLDDLAKEFHLSAEPDRSSFCEDQMSAFNKITQMMAGLVLLTGGPGSGKSFLAKHLAHWFRLQGRQVCLTATTGAAAVRFSRHAGTNHSTFGILVYGSYLAALHPAHPMRPVISQLQVLMIDEVSICSIDRFPQHSLMYRAK